MILYRYSYVTMKLDAITRLLEPQDVLCMHDHTIKGIAYDSRVVSPGYLFVAIRGEQMDGHDYVADAILRGAVAVVTEDDVMVPRTVTSIKVADSRIALAKLACAFHRDPASYLNTVGVTGTNGKTTVTHLLRQLLRGHEPDPGLIGTVEYRIGRRVIPATRTTPESTELQAMLEEMIDEQCRTAIMEVSSHALALHRVHGIDFDVAVFTNLTPDHLDFHLDLESYFAAKSTLFTNLGKGEKAGVAIVNIDDKWGRKLAAMSEVTAQVITYGLSEDADVRAEAIEQSSIGSVFRIVSPWGEADVQLPMLGRYNVSNGLAAIAAGGVLGLSLDWMVGRLVDAPPVPGRLERIATGRGLVFVDYAHTEDALENVLLTLRNAAVGRKIKLVFGCGGNRDVKKRAAMGKVASRLADYSILTNDNPRKEDPAHITKMIAAGFDRKDQFEIIHDREEAIAAALATLGKDELLLIAGKGHESYQEFASTIVPFDDREVTRRLLSDPSVWNAGKME